MITIAIHNTKGGVGTTTLAAHLCFLGKERSLHVAGVADPRAADLAAYLAVADIRCLHGSAELTQLTDLEATDLLVLDRPDLDTLPIDPDLWIIPITDRAGIDHAAALSDRLLGKIVWLGNHSRALTRLDIPYYLLDDVTLTATIPYSHAIAYSTERLRSVWSAPDLAQSPGARALRSTLDALLDDLLRDRRAPVRRAKRAPPPHELDPALRSFLKRKGALREKPEPRDPPAVTEPAASAPGAPDTDLCEAFERDLTASTVDRYATIERELSALVARIPDLSLDDLRADEPRAADDPEQANAPDTTTDRPSAPPLTTTNTSTDPRRDAPTARERDLFDEVAALSRAFGRLVTAADPAAAAPPEPEPIRVADFIDPLCRLSPHIGALFAAAFTSAPVQVTQLCDIDLAALAASRRPPAPAPHARTTDTPPDLTNPALDLTAPEKAPLAPPHTRPGHASTPSPRTPHARSRTKSRATAK